MKKLILFLAMASTTMFVSCGSDDSEGTPAATSIILTPSATTIDLGQPVTLTAKDNNGTDVTARATFFDGTTAITSPYTPTTVGPHSLTAKFDNLTSASVIVTVNAVAAENSIFINGENFELDNSVLVYWGGYAEDPEATVATHDWWSMITFDGEEGENNFIDVEFIVPVGEEELPTNATAVFKTIYEVAVGGAAVELESVEGGSITLGEWPSAINMPHEFSATADYNGDSSLEVNFSGNWLGVQDASARPAARNANGGVIKSTRVMSKAALAQAKAKFFANAKK